MVTQACTTSHPAVSGSAISAWIGEVNIAVRTFAGYLTRARMVLGVVGRARVRPRHCHPDPAPLSNFRGSLESDKTVDPPPRSGQMLFWPPIGPLCRPCRPRTTRRDRRTPTLSGRTVAPQHPPPLTTRQGGVPRTARRTVECRLVVAWARTHATEPYATKPNRIRGLTRSIVNTILDQARSWHRLLSYTGESWE